MSRRSRPAWVYVVLTALLAVLLLTLWLGEDSGNRHAVPQQVRVPDVVFEESGLHDIGPSQLPVSVGTKAAPEPLKHRGIALILDDVGYDLPALRRALALQIPMAIAILPNAPHAVEAAKLAHAAGYPVMLHMPMEPANPHYREHMDNSFIRVGMQREEVRRLMEEALARVPYVEGVNNHMGSGLTALEEPMRWVMEICREHKLFFIDSRTNKDTVAARMARDSGLRWGERRVFLDDSVEPELLKKSWRRTRTRLAKDGSVIVIAHPHRETLDFLQKTMSGKDRDAMVPLAGLLFPAVRHDEAIATK
ncbi:MAG: hypothetical protein COW19_02270 [Zetaproteobacteria bacterium CG12_big_fil_rev_8_21_14_0_65_55_1124]|nr:MAG: hypothetical protein COT53_06590 [Zetaproteobacteria bacterium CG08_land_8_20_14_0_20_55_17]PIW43524.1 MAG: hypothetical protein COW19_02270 [Zetaproteobacteria bacterium CG12_big_fil_rev_8_21_14_0_65_55_1124]PIY54423.1 MAG: hypothetical protein COZ01_00555 [Zetaproteobacteria bacterium CG_4_10_14_0_8_um_filter_55_43]PIZ38986.1 MAG: hypothetical protein COY36_04110 [Zetaproteobacteria bacterium CG_4_10_14_0_2_um_filter_55_20]PJB80291.1 MAG: hypothetical protein CO089_07595 [Zetaproteoba